MSQKALVIATVITLTTTLSCGSRTAPQSEALSSKIEKTTNLPQTVALSLKSSLRGRNLRVEGGTDLPNGAVIDYEIQHEGAAKRTDVPFDKMTAEGEAVVEGGHYVTNVNLTGWPLGEVEVWVAFETVLGTKQPAELLARFGKMGENLVGTNVTQVGNVKRVELTEKIRLK